MCVSKHAHDRGLWVYAPPGKFCKLDALRLLMRPLLAQSGTMSVRLGMYDSNLYRHPHAMQLMAVAEESKLLSFQCIGLLSLGGATT